MWQEEVLRDLEAAANPDKAPAMAAYMKNQFDFLGVQTPQLKQIVRPHLSTASQQPGIDWGFMWKAWETPYREGQYCAINYLSRVASRLNADDLPALKDLVSSKPWWDTVDSLSGIIGSLVLRVQPLKGAMLAWSREDFLWVRRSAILHQLSFKNQTDVPLLEEIILNNLGTREFFINKAIGWSLRQYAYTDPLWVSQFLENHRQQLSNLSVREASKHLKR